MCGNGAQDQITQEEEVVVNSRGENNPDSGGGGGGGTQCKVGRKARKAACEVGPGELVRGEMGGWRYEAPPPPCKT